MVHAVILWAVVGNASSENVLLYLININIKC